ncbi:hypothetical protein HFP89_08850 [Wenzhouxiangella sp. XN79A]|uniref:hypothetical protein n=1 Tax=Wenzhouxiangella sp. XN79A TaxID=2724193 RepID=UPI00144A4ECA|nr:hypothetical protein [Wenzhouxiangella sp. XN79A]NKI35273.1 hypothetical protein [Wenzhouxiangella sp. XN79A]
MNANQREIYGIVPEGMHRISWGAIFAGLIGAQALLWLLLLLGSALGASILDATDAGALGAGLGWGTIIWLILSFLVAYFIGGVMAGRLSSDPSPAGGMLHGVTVWSTATVLTLVFGALGIGATASLATHTAGDLTTSSARVVVESRQGIETTRELASEFADSELADEMAAAIKSFTAEVLAGTAEGIGQEETRQAISELDTETVTAVSRHLVADDTDQAIQRLSRATDLSRSQIDRIVSGLESRIEAAIADSAMLDQLQAAIRTAVNDALQAAADVAGPALTASELRAILSELDGDTLAEIAAHLMQGEQDRARNVLTANTSLTEQQVDRVIDEIESQFEQQLAQWREQAEEVLETASDYAQTAVWSLFFAALLSLLAAMVGGRVGAGRIRV